MMILQALQKEPMHGYLLMQSIGRQCMNIWKPTAGSLYPALEELKKEKLIEVKSIESKGRKKKVYEITGLGRKKAKSLSEGCFPPKAIELYKSKEFSKYSHEDFLHLFESMQRLFEKQLSEYRTSLLELAMLSRQGMLSAKQKKEFLHIFREFLEKVEKINKAAKKPLQKI